MKTVKPSVALFFLLLTYFVLPAADGNLSGAWKIAGVKVTGQTENKYYLADLYQSKGSLEFTVDGRVRYGNSPASKDVFYYTDGNKLVLSATRLNALKQVAPSAKNDMQDTIVQFVFALNNNVLTLTKVFEGYTETYTFTK